jgi:NADH:ubiquinone oxidoreductase subunit B-like Fe-S oxidoreductase
VGTGKGESGLIMVKGSLLPIHCIVTLGAVLPKGALVDVILRMTGIAVCRCSAINAAIVTGATGQCAVGSGKWENALAVVKRSLLPVHRVVTGFAISPKSAQVNIVLLMTGKAVSRYTGKNAATVARATGQCAVSAGKRESSLAVVKRSLLPVHCIMAPCTVRPESALVYIVLLMTGETVSRRYSVNATIMASAAA